MRSAWAEGRRWASQGPGRPACHPLRQNQREWVTGGRRLGAVTSWLGIPSSWPTPFSLLSCRHFEGG